MPSKASSTCATDGSSRPTRTPCKCSCTRYNPYKRQPKPSKLTLPIDFPTYSPTSNLITSSPTTFNKDIDTTLSTSRKRRRISRHDINFDPESAKALKPSPITPNSYSIARCDESMISPLPVFRYIGEEECLDIHIEKMITVIKGFEKAFWQT